MDTSYIGMLLELFPNLAIALLALWYLAQQNKRAIEAMEHTNDKLLNLLQQACKNLLDDVD